VTRHPGWYGVTSALSAAAGGLAGIGLASAGLAPPLALVVACATTFGLASVAPLLRADRAQLRVAWGFAFAFVVLVWPVLGLLAWLIADGE
jgi:hypothetical protein